MSTENAAGSVASQSTPTRWAAQAAISGALFTTAGVGVFAVFFGVLSSVDSLRVLRTAPANATMGGTVGEVLVGSVFVILAALGSGLLVALPVGVVLGLVNGGLARQPWGRRPWLVVVVAVVVGSLCGALLLAALIRSLEVSWLNAVIAAIAAVTAGAHLRREQRVAARRSR